MGATETPGALRPDGGRPPRAHVGTPGGAALSLETVERPEPLLWQSAPGLSVPSGSPPSPQYSSLGRTSRSSKGLLARL